MSSMILPFINKGQLTAGCVRSRSVFKVTLSPKQRQISSEEFEIVGYAVTAFYTDPSKDSGYGIVVNDYETLKEASRVYSRWCRDYFGDAPKVKYYFRGGKKGGQRQCLIWQSL